MARRFFVFMTLSKASLNMTNFAVSDNAGQIPPCPPLKKGGEGGVFNLGGAERGRIVFTSACSKLRFASLSYIAFTWLYLRRNSCRSLPYPTSSHEFEVMKQKVPLSFRSERPWK